MPTIPHCLERAALIAAGGCAWLALAGAASAATAAAATAAPGAPGASASCDASSSPAERHRCAEDEFLAAGKGYAARYAELSQVLTPIQRERLRRMQATWISYRTAACRFESSGQTQGTAFWSCAARLTRERAAALAAWAACPPGASSCTPPRP